MAKPSKQILAVVAPTEHNRIAQAIVDFVSQVPQSKISNTNDAAAEARQLGQRAAKRAALTAGSLALPPGPLGWLTLLPELIAIWKIQGQMVSDIAAAYGQHANLGREQMLWCLFRHTAAQAFRDLAVRMGDRLVFRRMSHTVAQRVARQVGAKLTQRTISEGVSRWLPVIGALGVGAYAYYDTGQVAKTAIALFSGEIGMDETDADSSAGGVGAETVEKPLASSEAVAAAGGATRSKSKEKSAMMTAVSHAVARARRKPVRPNESPEPTHVETHYDDPRFSTPNE